ncbi:MAG: hypothetical protein WD898_00060 [Candidatus Paceibacterota bacterium]
MKWQVYGVWLSMILSIVGLSIIVWKVDPASASPILKASFFITLFILIWSVATTAIFSIKHRLVKSRALNETADEIIFYDSFLTGLFITTVLMIFILIKRFV